MTPGLLKTDQALLVRPRHSVALIGMDGSGKSTQARMLAAELRGQGKRVVAIHPFGRKLLVFLPERHAVRNSATHTAQHQHGQRPERVRRVFAAIELLDIGLFLWLAYIWAFLWSCLPAQAGGREVWLVSDRSFDDLLVKHRRYGTLSAQVLQTARRLVPVPETTIWLQTAPSVAMARDGEFMACYYDELYIAYATAAREYRFAVVPATNQSPEQVRAEVESVLHLRAEDSHQTMPDWTGPRAATYEVHPPEAQASETR